jgi:hypothetical protein
MSKTYSPEVLQALREIADDHDLLYSVGRRKVEDVLVDNRDARISIIGRNNGLVIREKDGGDSNVIRLGTEMALGIGLKAIIEHLESK